MNTTENIPDEAVESLLSRHEQTIEIGLQSFVEVGEALLAIRDDRLYRLTHATFEAYLQQRWDMGRRAGYRLIEAAQNAAAIYQDVSHGTQISERQLRPLSKLDSDEQKREAWAQASEATTRQTPDGTPNPTSAEVAEAVDRVAKPHSGDTIIDDDGKEHVIAEVLPLDDEQADLLVDTEGDCIVQPRPEPSPITKPDLGNGISHPARYSTGFTQIFADLLSKHCGQDAYLDVLDPFAGTGRIHELERLRPRTQTFGIEIEPEWAAMHEQTQVGDALDLPWLQDTFDAIITSPTYGNRLADSHNATDPHLRRSYTHDLGRPLAEHNSGAMQWGDTYRQFHHDAWEEALRVLRAGGLFILNIKDHIRNGRQQYVAGWHVTELINLGCELLEIYPVPVRSLQQGTNAAKRIQHELIFVLRNIDKLPR